MIDEHTTSTTMTFSHIVSIVLHRKRVILLFLLLTELVIGVYSFIMPQTFTSVTSLMPPEQKSSGNGIAALLQSAAPGISLGGMDSKSMSLSVDIIQSTALSTRIINYMHLFSHPFYKGIDSSLVTESVKNSLIVDSKIRSGVTYIEFSASTSYFPNNEQASIVAKLTSDVANATSICLDQMLREKNVSTARKTREFIERMAAINKLKLDSLQTEFELFQTTNKVLTIDDQTKAIVTNAVSIGSELAKAQIELTEALQEFQPGSSIVNAYTQKVSQLQAQYAKVQSGGLTESDRFSIPLQNVPKLARRYLNLMRDMKISEQINA